MLGSSRNKVPLWLVLALILVSLIGFIDAGYLAVMHYQGGTPVCSALSGCEEVATSRYSTVGGIPVAGLGVLYYLSIFVLALIYFDTSSYRVKQILPYITAIGFIASLWFVYLQVFVIEAICIYCMGSAVSSTIIFILGLLSLKYKK